jgi:multidrug/hemolysin transport system ATP-binding protein
MVVQGTPAELRKTHSSSILSVASRDPEALRNACARHGLTATMSAGMARITVKNSADAFTFLQENHSLVDDFEFRHGTMDDVFLSVTAGRASTANHAAAPHNTPEKRARA